MKITLVTGHFAWHWLGSVDPQTHLASYHKIPLRYTIIHCVQLKCIRYKIVTPAKTYIFFRQTVAQCPVTVVLNCTVELTLLLFVMRMHHACTHNVLTAIFHLQVNPAELLILLILILAVSKHNRGIRQNSSHCP